ncbi:MAG: PKD domain-containing protein [Putridiphycobacter sp.]|nr:PKD domain-containing protein [Putridiphycobacter sp.]
MKRFLFISLTLLSYFFSYASHIVGGEMFYDCLGGNQYRVTVKLYRDCNSTGAQFDPQLPVTVFDGNDNQIDNFTIPFPGSTNLQVNFNNNPCITIPSNICIEEAIYEKIVTLPSSNTGYTLSYQRCCRGPNVTNLSAPAGQGLTLTAKIPVAALAVCNSSPRFDQTPPLLLCANQTLQFNHAATDPDGDSLAYYLCSPYQGGTSNSPAPNPASPPQYNLVNWGTGFNATFPFGTGSPTNINNSTGFLTAVPQFTGIYAVGICVSEYRNGVLLNTTRRDFLFRVLDCEIELAAVITPQTELPTFVSFCQGLNVQFKNESFGGTSYLWDFGVSNTTADQSTAFEPSFTFPGPGTYTVTLIVSKSQGCSDTTSQDFIINDQVEAEFVPPPPQCIFGNSYNFVGGGIIPPGSTFYWDFGPTAMPSFSTDQNPTNIVFDKAGYNEVSFTVMYDNCEETFIDEVLVYGPPKIAFKGDDNLKCAPYEASFVNQSFAYTPYFSFWNFGDGTPPSTSTNPLHVYKEPGVYDVSLTIWTTDGCIDTLELTKEELVVVEPKPTAGFTVDPLVRDEYEAEFTFINTSDDAYKNWFYFGNGRLSTLHTTTYVYPKPGIYFPYQVVRNVEGCKDTAWAKLTVNPVIPIIVPNAFTPGNGGVNSTFKPILYRPQNYYMYIYNRWGELVFQSENPEAEWDGNYGGEPAQSGVYLWYIRYYEYDTGKLKNINGHVTLLR